MATLNFRNAKIREAHMGYKEGAGAFMSVHFTADLSEPILEAMEWQSPAECYENPVKLIGELTGHTMILTPTNKELQHNEINMECGEIESFQFFRIKANEKRGASSELRFVAVVREAGAAAKIDNYYRTIGQKPALLRLDYAPSVQGKLEFPASKEGGKEEVATECKGCAAGLQLMPSDDSAHIDGSPCAKWEAKDKDAPLVSATLMGGTHQKKRGKAEAATQ